MTQKRQMLPCVARHMCDTSATQVRHKRDTREIQVRHNCDTCATQVINLIN
jgi:hypothetical protein